MLNQKLNPISLISACGNILKLFNQNLDAWWIVRLVLLLGKMFSNLVVSETEEGRTKDPFRKEELKIHLVPRPLIDML